MAKSVSTTHEDPVAIEAECGWCGWTPRRDNVERGDIQGVRRVARSHASKFGHRVVVSVRTTSIYDGGTSGW